MAGAIPFFCCYTYRKTEADRERDMTTLNEDLIYEILSAVEEIPAGKVASYGQIALLILLIPYVRHYYILENEVQKMYGQYDALCSLSMGNTAFRQRKL